MPLPSFSGNSRLNTLHKFSVAGIAAAGVASLAFAVVPGASAGAQTQSIAVKPVSFNTGTFGTKTQQDALTEQSDAAAAQAKTEAAKVEQNADAKAKADQEHSQQTAAGRSEQRVSLSTTLKPITPKAAPKPAAPAAPSYPENVDGWIRHSLDVMRNHGIPGSYNGIYRNLMRESSGNPNAINLWDSNAAKGIPSKGLLQVIDPTFRTYHVPGTSWNIYDPVANITAACNYAFHRYGSMDNVNSAY